MSPVEDQEPPPAEQLQAEQQAERARSQAAAHDNMHVSVAPGETPPYVELGQLEDVVLDVDLPQKLRARAHLATSSSSQLWCCAA